MKGESIKYEARTRNVLGMDLGDNIYCCWRASIGQMLAKARSWKSLHFKEFNFYFWVVVK